MTICRCTHFQMTLSRIKIKYNGWSVLSVGGLLILNYLSWQYTKMAENKCYYHRRVLMHFKSAFLQTLYILLPKCKWSYLTLWITYRSNTTINVWNQLITKKTGPQTLWVNVKITSIGINVWLLYIFAPNCEVLDNIH